MSKESTGSKRYIHIARQTLFILFACFSMVVSALGTCLCPHHETWTEKPRLSCHSSTHRTETVRSDPSSAKMQSQCICSADAPPAIVGKSDRKKSEGSNEAHAAAISPQLDPIFSEVVSTDAPYLNREVYHSSLHRISAPSRAPPRL
jgi:hypothetical protein